MRDVVVVGAGHNALVAACYLARAGLDVEVVERRSVVGGAVSTVERFGGYRMDVGSSAHIMVRHTGIIEDLDLAAMGLAYQDLDPWGFAPFGDEAITFHVDLDATCASIAQVCGAQDAEAYREFATTWGKRNLKVFEAFAQPPTPGRLGRSLMSIGRGSGVDGIELSRQFLRSGDGLLDEHFTDERLKTALAWLGAQSGPPTHEVATADLVGWNAVMHHRPPGHPVGGSGMLSVALARRLEQLGGTVRLGDGCARIATASGRVLGVETDSGDRIPAATVVAGCHVLTTFELVGWDSLPPAFAARARSAIRVGNGIGMVVRLATSALPRYPAGIGGGEWRALQLLAPSRAMLRQAHADFMSGRPPETPAALAMTFSAFDDTIAPPDKHNVTVWGQWHPYELRTGEHWDDIAEREGHKLVLAVDAAATGFADSVEHMHVQTPLDLERELGLRRGNVMHVEMSLDQMFAWRPLPELAGYRTPVEGLYLTGASTHPGGGVFGASGRSAARVLLGDRRPWWRRR
ncbi:MAG TPA: NAD(P)/FAD-dependent oxidoreductase [Egibacteraceae bacterium]|nr:NAD(P)/FAD-dependent oxidoreductase [Egibacteraceae bacterium]HVM14598.1 NAD(P)/FAD-dependent oxidoreductase [Egibacteraceae bacterium]HVM21411.1 NAD(P)/FAD-dependent oxidoreductase [Egibacteraceae bacterium]